MGRGARAAERAALVLSPAQPERALRASPLLHAAGAPQVFGAARARGLCWLLPPPAAAARARLRAHRERALVGALAGAAAGAFVNSLLHPLDTVKVQLQVRGSPFKGPVGVVRHVLARHGVVAGVARLYRGLPAAMAGSAASSALYFGAYEAAKGVGAPPPAAALLGNALSSVILVPKEVVKSRMQAGAPGGVAAVLASAIRTRGVRGLYAGYLPTLMRNAPSNMISFSAYEALRWAALAAQRARVRRQGGNADELTALPPAVTAVAGALAGCLAAVATHPLDLVKTRLQTQGAVAPVGAALYAGVAGTLRAVAREEGARGLARGLSTRVTYNALFSAVGLAAFEAAKRAIAARRAEAEDAMAQQQQPQQAGGRVSGERTKSTR